MAKRGRFPSFFLTSARLLTAALLPSWLCALLLCATGNGNWTAPSLASRRQPNHLLHALGL